MEKQLSNLPKEHIEHQDEEITLTNTEALVSKDDSSVVTKIIFYTDEPRTIGMKMLREVTRKVEVNGFPITEKDTKPMSIDQIPENIKEIHLAAQKGSIKVRASWHEWNKPENNRITVLNFAQKRHMPNWKLLDGKKTKDEKI